MEIPDLRLWLLTPVGKIVLIIFLYLVAWLIYRLSHRLANTLISGSRITVRQPNMRPERRQTLVGLVAGALTFLAFAVATLISLSLFVDVNTLIWMVGLLGAGFGFGSRSIISDFLSGISFMFEDTFDVSEKVELPGLVSGSISVIGVVEAVYLRTTTIRSMSGEPFTVPNGEIRVVRNFSRGKYSMTNIKIKLATADLSHAIPLLEALGEEAVTLLPSLLEPWQLISETGEMGQQTELSVIAKARFGKAGEMRPKLLTLVQERMTDANIELAS